MQADGYIGGSFQTLGSVTFTPAWYLSQNASTGSIYFFALLHAVLTRLGAKGLGFNYSITSAGN